MHRLRLLVVCTSMGLAALVLTGCGPPVLLEGTVTAAGSGAPVVGAEVALYSDTEEVHVVSVVTHGDGAFRVTTEDVDPGRYRISIDGTWWPDAPSWDEAVPVELSPSAATTIAPVLDVDGQTLSGTVRTWWPGQLLVAVVDARTGHHVANTTTDEYGYWSMPNLAMRPYKVLGLDPAGVYRPTWLGTPSYSMAYASEVWPGEAPEIAMLGRDCTPEVAPGLDLSGEDLSGRIFIGCDLSGADLTGADLTGADLAWASLSSASLVGADLTGANLGDADLRGASIDDGILALANLSLADLTGASLRGADMFLVTAVEADFTGADLSDADLRWGDLPWSVFAGANLDRTDLTITDMKNTDLTEATLREALLDGTLFAGSDVTRTTFLDATGTPFGGAALVYDATTCPDGFVAGTTDTCVSHGFEP